jgi:hypothetical protein
MLHPMQFRAFIGAGQNERDEPPRVVMDDGVIRSDESELDFLQVGASGDFDWWVIVPGQPG